MPSLRSGRGVLRDPQRCPNMSSRPRFCRVWGRRGADPTLGFIILKTKSDTTPLSKAGWLQGGFAYPRILSRFRCKVGLQSGGTWFSSGTVGICKCVKTASLERARFLASPPRLGASLPRKERKGKHLSNIYRTSIENRSNLYRTSI